VDDGVLLLDNYLFLGRLDELLQLTLDVILHLQLSVQLRVYNQQRSTALYTPSKKEEKFRTARIVGIKIRQLGD